MKIIISSLHSILKKEKRVGVINIIQFQRLYIQRFFYLWLENSKDRSFSLPSVKSSTKNVRSTSSSGTNKRPTPSSYSIDESKQANIRESSKRKKLMMGSFDFETKNFSSGQKNRGGMSRVNHNSSNIGHSRHLNVSSLSMAPLEDMTSDLKARGLLKLMAVLTEKNSHSALAKQIKTITNISNQQAKNKKAMILSLEVQTLIDQSCKFI